MDFSIDEEHLMKKVDDTKVLVHKDRKEWDWDAVIEVLEGPFVNPCTLSI